MAALAGGGSLVVPLLAVVVVGTAKGHEQGLKRRHREAGQLLKNSGASADLLEVHHAIASRSRRKEIAYSRYGLFPIKSYVFPEGSTLYKDSGFQGYEPEGVSTYQPKKKPRGKELTPEEKETNRLISRVRVKVEHSIGGVKVFRIVHDIFRNIKEGFVDLVMGTVCGLFNFRLESRPLT